MLLEAPLHHRQSNASSYPEAELSESESLPWTEGISELHPRWRKMRASLTLEHLLLLVILNALITVGRYEIADQIAN